MVRLHEVKCDVTSKVKRLFRKKEDSEELVLRFSHMLMAYASVLGHTLRLQDFRHISGASRYDVKAGEDLYQFIQQNFLRTTKFISTCARHAHDKLFADNAPISAMYNKVKNHYLLIGTIKIFDPTEIFRLVAMGKGEAREVSHAAVDKGLYTFEDRPEWYRKYFPEEYVLYKKDLICPKMIILTDSAYHKKIVTLKELVNNGTIADLENKYPKLKDIVKFTGETDRFFTSTCLNVGSGEDFHNFHADYMMRHLLDNFVTRGKLV